LNALERQTEDLLNDTDYCWRENSFKREL